MKNYRDQSGQAKLVLIAIICLILIGIGAFYFVQTSYFKGDEKSTTKPHLSATLDDVLEHMEATHAIIGMCSRDLKLCIPSLVDQKEAVLIFWNEVGLLGSFDEKRLFAILSQSKLTHEERDQRLDKLSQQYQFLQEQINTKIAALEEEWGIKFENKPKPDLEKPIQIQIQAIYRKLTEQEPVNGYPDVYDE